MHFFDAWICCLISSIQFVVCTLVSPPLVAIFRCFELLPGLPRSEHLGPRYIYSVAYHLQYDISQKYSDLTLCTFSLTCYGLRHCVAYFLEGLNILCFCLHIVVGRFWEPLIYRVATHGMHCILLLWNMSGDSWKLFIPLLVTYLVCHSFLFTCCLFFTECYRFVSLHDNLSRCRLFLCSCVVFGVFVTELRKDTHSLQSS